MKRIYSVGFSLSTIFLLVIIVPQLAYSQATAPPKDIEMHPPIHIKIASASVPNGITPAQIRHAYRFDQLSCSYTAPTWPSTNLCGNGQAVAIIDAFDDPNVESDLAMFNTQFNLPPCTTSNGCFVKLTPEGQPRPNFGWTQEISLDVEWAHAIAPGAKIILVESKNAFTTPLFHAVDIGSSQSGVHQVSMSWGSQEYPSEILFDKHFKKTGVSFFAASGDSGSGVEYPAASRFVIGVGGTTLNLDSQGNVISESAWSGSGGGISTIEPKPSYQLLFNTNSKRGIPDVSYDSDPSTGFPVYDSYRCSRDCWIQVGGTSDAAPQWAALFAIANSVRITPISSINFGTGNIVYSAAQGSSYSQNFRDITAGTNGNCGSICTAVTGYDFVTGLGSPLANNLFSFLGSH
ncbi:MAG: S53 family peptidase [Thaumarchaeota archaeon]|nr:S53 family peptidase [Nitrososphaerota archaeon]